MLDQKKAIDGANIIDFFLGFIWVPLNVIK